MKFYLLLLMVVLSLSSVSAITLYETYNDTSLIGLDTWGVNWEGQTFTIGTVGLNTDINLINISVNGFRNGNPANVTYYIRAVNSSGHPTGANLSQGSFDPSGITTSVTGQQINISMSPMVLEESTQYTLIASNPTGNTTNSFRWNTNSSGGYAGGSRTASGNSGVGWNSQPGHDAMFWIWGNNANNITSVLNTPANGTTTTGNINFSSSHNSDPVNGFNLTNATLIVWDSTGSVFNQTTISLTGTSNTSNITVANFTFDTFTWNVLACADNGNTTACTFADENFTVNWIGFEVVDEIFTSQTTEGNVELFSLEVEVQTGFQPIEANLIWNDSIFSGTINNLGGGSYNFTRELVIPSVGADANISFFWEVKLDSGSGFESNTSAQNQTVLNLDIDDCSVGTLAIVNYSLFEEESQAILNGTIEISLELRSSDNTESIVNFSQAYNNVTFAPVCLNAGSLNSSSYLMNTITSYTAPNFAQEFHNIQSGVIDSATAPINVSLFDLSSADSTTFSMTYKGVDFLPIPGALFNIQRKYVSEGVFKSVEIVESDTEGGAKAHFDVEGVIYRISITVGGVLIDSFDNVKVLCDNAITGDCSINLNSFASNTDFSDWETLGGINYNMVFDESARTITVTFNVIDGTTKLVTLNGTEFGGAETPLCSSSLLSSAGTLVCTIPSSFGNGTFVSTLFIVNSPGKAVTTRLFTISAGGESVFGVDAFVFAFILVATFPLMMVSSTIGVVLGLILGVLASFMLLLIDNSGLLGPTTAFMWLMVAGAILIYKLFRRDS